METKTKYKHKVLGWVAEWTSGIYRVTDGTGYIDDLMCEIVENGQDWILQQPEKSYEIVSYKDKGNGYVYKLREDSKEYVYRGGSGLVYTKTGREILTGSELYEIYSIRRKSDGEIYSLGDKIVHNEDDTDVAPIEIKSFEVVNDEMTAWDADKNYSTARSGIEIAKWKKVTEPGTTRITIGDSVYTAEEREEMEHKNVFWAAERELGISWEQIKEIVKANLEYWGVKAIPEEKKEVLMTTEDGKEVYQGDEVTLYRLNVNDWTTDIAESCPECISYDTRNYKYWIREENMQEYIEYEKPILNQKEVVTLITKELSKQRDRITRPSRQEVIEMLKYALDSYVIEKLNKQ